MTARLLTSVIVDGEVMEAGTEATAALRKAIPNPVAWDDGGEPADDAAEKKSTGKK